MNQTKFAIEMGVLPQHVTNWKRRGLPADQYQRAAKVLEITVDELIGEGAEQTGEPCPTLPNEVRLLEAFRWLHEDEQEEVLLDLTRRAERYRQVAERVMKKGRDDRDKDPLVRSDFLPRREVQEISKRMKKPASKQVTKK